MAKPFVLKVSEVSKILRIQRAKVYILIETGALTGCKVGKDWRITTESVENLIGSLPADIFKHSSAAVKSGFQCVS